MQVEPQPAEVCRDKGPGVLRHQANQSGPLGEGVDGMRRGTPRCPSLPLNGRGAPSLQGVSTHDNHRHRAPHRAAGGAATPPPGEAWARCPWRARTIHDALRSRPSPQRSNRGRGLTEAFTELFKLPRQERVWRKSTRALVAPSGWRCRWGTCAGPHSGPREGIPGLLLLWSAMHGT